MSRYYQRLKMQAEIATSNAESTSNLLALKQLAFAEARTAGLAADSERRQFETSQRAAALAASGNGATR